MTPAEWERLQDIVDGALEMARADRAAHLNAACVGNGEIRRRAEDLIEAHDCAGSFLSAAISEKADQVLTTGPPGDIGSPKPGEMISGYRILSKIGQGGMGFVLKAEDTILKRLVALKFITPDWMEDLPVERLIREAKAASALNHPNILTIHGVIQSESTVAIVMELVDGAPLRKHCGAPLPVAEVIRISRQVALALAAAHSAGIVHRDVKPENVMVRPDGYVKVLDFGLACNTAVLDRRSEASFAAGTLQYMAPEQIRAEGATADSDIFSFGLVLYEMLTGKHPFAAESTLETAYAISHLDPLPPSAVNPGVPQRLDELVLQMLAKDLSSRPTAQQVKARLGEIDQPSVQSPRWILLRRAVLAASIAAVLILAGDRFWPRPGREIRVLEALPFTTESGLQMEPAVSPSGQLVAYVWNGPLQDNFDIYIQPVKGGAPRRFTSHPDPDISPAWSHDGRRIAYVRRVAPEVGQIWIQALEQGPGRMLAELRMPELNNWQDRRSLSWSPDGQWLAISTNEQESDSYSVFLVSVATGALRRLTTPPPLGRPFGDKGPVFSPDGKSIAFIRTVDDGRSELWVLPLTTEFLPAGSPRLVATGKPRNVGPQWTPDGREIIFSSGIRGRMNLSRVSPWSVPRAQILVGAGEGGLNPALPAKADGAAGVTLIYTRDIVTINLRSLQIRHDARGVPSSINGSSPLAPNSSTNEHASFSPDGKKIAFVSNRSGYREVWAFNSDGSDARQWTAMQCGDIGVPRWSHDARRITFSAQCNNATEVYVLDRPNARPRRLTDSSFLNENSTWSADDKWIYFTSYRTGGQRIWRIPSAGGTAVQVTHQPSSNAWISRDGHTLYFSSHHDGSESLWTMNAEGGAPKLLISGVSFFTIGRDGVYFTVLEDPANSSARLPLAYLDFATRRVIPLPFSDDGIEGYVFTLSPDENSIVYSRDDFHSIGLMKVENFR